MTALKRTLGPWSLWFYGLGAILGAGVYSVIGVAAGRAGDGLWISFVGSGVVALLTALSYAELATLFPEAGAELIYLKRALPKRAWFAFTVAAMIVLSSAATVATVSIAFGGYLRELTDLPVAVSAIALVVVLTGVGIWGVRESTIMAGVFTVIEVLGLLLVVWAGMRSDRFGEALASLPSLDVLAGASIVFFAFLGFENIVNLAGETENPGHALPRAILWSLGAAILVYTLVALSVVTLMSPQDLGRSEAPLADAVRQTSPLLARALGGIALFATANTALASIVSGSRVIYAMAEKGDVPKWIGGVLRRRKTPWIGTLILSGMGLVLFPLGGIGTVASVSSFAALVAFACVNLALVVLRRSQPGLDRPFRVPGAIADVPVLPVVGGLCSLALIAQLEWLAIVVGSGFAVVLGVGRAFWFGNRDEAALDT